jgi:serine/threonine protein kinase
LVLEHCLSDLEYVLRNYQNQLNKEDRAYIFKEMIRAVDVMHKNNIIHRDIKPANFVIDNNCNIKLIDFGLSKH